MFGSGKYNDHLVSKVVNTISHMTNEVDCICLQKYYSDPYFEIGKRFDWSHVRYRRLTNRKAE